MEQSSKTLADKFNRVDKMGFPIQDPFEFYVKSSTKENIKLITYEYPAQTPEIKAVLIFSAGYGICANRSAFYFKKFAEQGITIYSYERRGFGLSGGRRNETEGVQEDLELFIQILQERTRLHQNISKFLYGVSMGGFMSFQIAKKFPGFFKGIILEMPFLSGRSKMNGFQRLVIRSLNYFKPNMLISTVDKKFKEFIDQTNIENDPEFQLVIRPSTLLFIDNEVKKAQYGIEQIKDPILVMLGRQDDVVDNKGVQELFEKIQVDDKQLKLYPGLTHISGFLDGDYQLMQSDVLQWIQNRI